MRYHVLFLCTANSATSIMAEVLLKALGGDGFRAFSAGSRPVGRVHPMAIAALVRGGYCVDGIRSKSWDEFTREGAPSVEFVITVCDSMAGVACPVFPGRPVTAHWSIADPETAAGGEEQRLRAFMDAMGALRRRVQALTSLPFDSVDKFALRSELAEIGRS